MKPLDDTLVTLSPKTGEDFTPTVDGRNLPEEYFNPVLESAPPTPAEPELSTRRVPLSRGSCALRGEDREKKSTSMNPRMYRLVTSIIDPSQEIEEWTFHLGEVSKVLSTLPRYLGRLKRTVWDHSFRVSQLACKDLEGRMLGPRYDVLRDCRERALWHDGSEAFTGDVPGPMKVVLGDDFKLAEERIQKLIYEMAGVDSRTLTDKYGPDLAMQIIDCVHLADKADYEWEQETYFKESNGQVD